jgi:hypothetical protein
MFMYGVELFYPAFTLMLIQSALWLIWAIWAQNIDHRTGASSAGMEILWVQRYWPLVFLFITHPTKRLILGMEQWWVFT